MNNSALSSEIAERNAIAFFRQMHCNQPMLLIHIKGEAVINNNEDECQFDSELLKDEVVLRRPTKASFLSPLQTQDQTTEKPQVTPQEREAEKLEQCRAAGRQGGRTRSKLWAPVREFAIKLSLEYQRYSTAKTAYAIAEMVVDYARQSGLNMSPSNAVRTISKWIRDDKKLEQR